MGHTQVPLADRTGVTQVVYPSRVSEMLAPPSQATMPYARAVHALPRDEKVLSTSLLRLARLRSDDFYKNGYLCQRDLASCDLAPFWLTIVMSVTRWFLIRTWPADYSVLLLKFQTIKGN